MILAAILVVIVSAGTLSTVTASAPRDGSSSWSVWTSFATLRLSAIITSGLLSVVALSICFLGQTTARRRIAPAADFVRVRRTVTRLANFGLFTVTFPIAVAIIWLVNQSTVAEFWFFARLALALITLWFVSHWCLRFRPPPNGKTTLLVASLWVTAILVLLVGFQTVSNDMQTESRWIGPVGWLFVSGTSSDTVCQSIAAVTLVSVVLYCHHAMQGMDWKRRVLAASRSADPCTVHADVCDSSNQHSSPIALSRSNFGDEIRLARSRFAQPTLAAVFAASGIHHARFLAIGLVGLLLFTQVAMSFLYRISQDEQTHRILITTPVLVIIVPTVLYLVLSFPGVLQRFRTHPIHASQVYRETFWAGVWQLRIQISLALPLVAATIIASPSVARQTLFAAAISLATSFAIRNIFVVFVVVAPSVIPARSQWIELLLMLGMVAAGLLSVCSLAWMLQLQTAGIVAAQIVLQLVTLTAALACVWIHGKADRIAD